MIENLVISLVRFTFSHFILFYSCCHVIHYIFTYIIFATGLKPNHQYSIEAVLKQTILKG